MSTEGSRQTRREFVQTTLGAGAVAAATSAGAAQEGEEHVVDMTDNLVFDPDEISIAPGDTIVWDNVGTIGHTVTAYEDQIPEEAEFFASGGFESESAARGAYPDGDVPGGGTYSHTFSVAGVYEYFCIPHEGAGMLATVNVGDVGGNGGGGDGEQLGPEPFPEVGNTFAVVLLLFGLATLGFAYLFMKYGGDYGLGDEKTGQ